MKQLFFLSSYLLLLAGLSVTQVNAGGISVDAGLTPAQDRWIVRSQLISMGKKDDQTNMGREMQTWVVPVVIAYGLHPSIALMVRQKFLYRKMTMMGTTESNRGIGDLFFLVKYKAYRLNTREYTFGVATTFGAQVPTGDSTFSSDTLNFQPGVFVSYRRGLWAIDFATSFKLNDFMDKNKGGVGLGDEFETNLALAYQFSVASSSNMSLTPVVEFSYNHIQKDMLNGVDKPNTGESILHISPGLKWTISSTIIEALAQIPISQNQNGNMLQRDITARVGFRHMF